jgi:hypothetical protein
MHQGMDDESEEALGLSKFLFKCFLDDDAANETEAMSIYVLWRKANAH